MPTHSSFEEQIRAYNEELRRYYAQSHPAVQEESTKPIPADEPAPVPETVAEVAPEAPVDAEVVPEEPEVLEAPDDAAPVERPWESARVEEWMDQILRSAQQPTDPWDSVESFTEEAPLPEPEPAYQSPEEPGDIGFLQVRVFSARGAVPLVGAIVSVIGHDSAGQETLLHLNQTDQSGIAPQVSLPTPDRALSLKPGDATPFFTYIVQVSAPGFATVRNEGVTVYGGVTSLQGVPMIPLPEPQIDYENAVVIRPGGAPPELN